MPHTVIAVLAAQHRGDLVEHHPVDLADQAGALGRGQEAAGRDQATVGFVGETQQRLVLGHPPIRERDDRLEMQDEQILSQRTAQSCQPGPAV